MIHISKTWLGGHYKAWRQSDDAKEFAGSELVSYALLNDLSTETIEVLREWESDGFREEEDVVMRRDKHGVIHRWVPGTSRTLCNRSTLIETIPRFFGSEVVTCMACIVLSMSVP